MRGFNRAALGAALAFSANSLEAQSPPAIKLAPAEKKLEQEFSSIVALRELADGRVLVADLTENKLVVADFVNGSVTQVGRVGQGPGEYQNPRWLYRLGGDSTFLVEQRTNRWHLLHGARIVATVPADDSVYRVFSRQAIGADARGNLLRTSSFADGRGAAIPANGPDSMWLLRANRKTARVDTLGRLKAQKSEIRTSTNARGEVTGVQIFMAPFSAPEQVAIYEDGSLAIARIAPYRIDWMTPDGRLARGRALPWPVTKVTERDVEFLYSSRPGRAPSGTPAEQEAARRKLVEDGMKLVPDALPPFTIQALIPAEDGTLLIRHNQTANQPHARYDIVDRTGTLRGTIAMAKGETIAAVSKKWVYVVSVDDDGLNFLRRHPWSDRSVPP